MQYCSLKKRIFPELITSQRVYINEFYILNVTLSQLSTTTIAAIYRRKHFITRLLYRNYTHENIECSLNKYMFFALYLASISNLTNIRTLCGFL